MNKLTFTFIIVAGLGILLGYQLNSFIKEFYAAPTENKMMDHHHDAHTPAYSHTHKKINIPNDEPIPKINLTIHTDPKSGWNLQVEVSHFRFAPKNASLEHQPGEGHMHLYIDGKKITRLYSEWYHIPADSLQAGEHEVLVTLSANDHSDYTYNDEIISASQTFTSF